MGEDARERLHPATRPTDDWAGREPEVFGELDVVIDPIQSGETRPWIGAPVPGTVEDEQPHAGGIGRVRVGALEPGARGAVKRDHRSPAEITPLAPGERPPVTELIRD